MTIKEIKELLKTDVTEEQIAELESDPRSGVQKLLVSYRKRQVKLLEKKQAFEQRFAYEKNSGLRINWWLALTKLDVVL